MLTRRHFLVGTVALCGGAYGDVAPIPSAVQRDLNGISVDASVVVRRVPRGIGGVCINGHTPEFATNGQGINFQGDLEAARVGLVRTVGYPDDKLPGHDVVYVDRNVRAIVRAGATPLFVQYIAPGLPYLRSLRSDGVGETSGTVTTNLVALVRRYLGAPYNLRTQYWEIGNEPEGTIDYKIPRASDYTGIFNACHDALVAAGLRDHVVLCGPAVGSPYGFPPGGYNTQIIDQVLTDCAHSVDVVTYHTYAGATSTDALLNAPFNLDDMEDSARIGGVPYGMPVLLERMRRVRFGRPNVGVGITEHNTTTAHHEIASGLWNLALTQYSLYNPRSRITTAFVFDDYGAEQDGFGHYDAAKHRDYCYWALWINGNLRGSDVVARRVTSAHNGAGRSSLLVAATRDAAHLFVEVINRSPNAIEERVVVRAKNLLGEPMVFSMAAGVLPNRSQMMRMGQDFHYRFPPLSASVFCFPLGSVPARRR